MSNPGDTNDFFTEEKCVPVRRGGNIVKKSLPRELKPKFSSKPEEQLQQPSPSPDAAQTPMKTVEEPNPCKEADPVAKNKSIHGQLDVGKTQTEASVHMDDNENNSVDGQEPKKKKVAKKPVVAKKKNDTAMAVFMDEGPPAPGQVQFIDDDENDDAGKKKKEKGGKKAAGAPAAAPAGAPAAPGQVQFIDDEDEGTGKKKKTAKKTAAAVPGQVQFMEDEDDDAKNQKSLRKKKKDKGKIDRPGSVRGKKNTIPATITAFASPGGPAAGTGSVFHKKEQGSARPKAKKGSHRGSLRVLKSRAGSAPPPQTSKERAKVPNSFFKTMYSKAKNKVGMMSKAPASSRSSMSSSDDSLIATDANMTLKNDVAAVYGMAADYPKGVMPAKTDKNHPDKLFPGGRPFWLTRDEKPPEAKVMILGAVNKLLVDGDLELVQRQDAPKDFIPYTDDLKTLKARDEELLLDGCRILSNTVVNTLDMKVIALGEPKKVKKSQDKSKFSKVKFVYAPQVAIYTRKQQKQKKFTKFAFKSAVGTDAQKLIHHKKKKSMSGSKDD